MGSRTTSVAIAGAGIGGLTVALALLRQGWRVRVYEQAPALGEVGAGITLSAGAGRGLAALGLEAPLLAASLPVPAVAFAHYRTGALLAGVFDRGAPPDHGFATPRHIHRADLHAILLHAVRALDAEAVCVGHRLVGVWPGNNAVALDFAGGATASADLLIAADGTRSVVRRLVFGAGAPHFAGQVAFRCLVPAERAAPFMGAGNAVVSVGAGRIFHRYRICGGAIVNVIGMAQSDGWHQEGWNTPASIAEFHACYRDFHADVTGLIGCAPPDSLIKWGLFVHPPLAAWSTGRVVLLGDAAHPILPFLGLGGALAIEDGVVLARALAAAPDAQSAFAAYQAARAPRVDQIRRDSLRQGEIIQARDPDRDSIAAAPSQDTALYDYDPSTVGLAFM